MKLLIIGDIYGDPGIEILDFHLKELKNELKPHLIIANAENSSSGRGISKRIYNHLLGLGINIFTMGNHVWGNREIKEFIEDSNILRPANYNNLPGNGYIVKNINGLKVLVINILGRAFINLSLDNPFKCVNEIIENVDHDFSILDIHAEATSEKIAMGHFFDGKIDIIFGTHTHVQTNDARLMPKGSFYLTDVGMTGPLDGVIGVEKEIVINRFLNGFSTHNKVSKGRKQLNAWFIDTELQYSKLIHLEKE